MFVSFIFAVLSDQKIADFNNRPHWLFFFAATVLVITIFGRHVVYEVNRNNATGLI